MARISGTSSLLLALVLGPLAAILAVRVPVLSLGYFNAPGRMPLHANFSSYEIKFPDQIRSCEDVLLVEDRRIALLACDPGRETWNTVMGFFVSDKPEPNAELYAYKYDETDTLVPIKVVGFKDELRTIGFEFHEPSSTLLVTNHKRHGGPRIEQFRLDLDTMTATHVRSIVHPLITIPNSIAMYSPSEFYVTNQHHFIAGANRLLWALESYLAPPIATIVHVRILPSGELDARVVARQAYPNGVTVFDKGSKLAVASSNTRQVYIYAIESPPAGSEAAHPTLRHETTIKDLPFLPDNVAVGRSDGALLIAGHPHLRSLNKFSHSRHICNRPDGLARAGADEARKCEEIRAASWASEWTPEKGVQHIYSGWDYPTSATVVRDRKNGMGIVAGLYAKGILVWRD